MSLSFTQAARFPRLLGSRNRILDMVNVLALASSLSWEEAYMKLIDAVHQVHLMPDDARCIPVMLEISGYEKITFPPPGIFVRDMDGTLIRLDMERGPILSAILYTEKVQLALLPVTGADHSVSFVSQGLSFPEAVRVRHLWIRHPHGQPSATPPSPGHTSHVWQGESHGNYRFRQENPDGNAIGDCVIRALSSGLNITWDETIDRLVAASGFRTNRLNTDIVFRTCLRDAGFMHHEALSNRYGHRYTSLAFSRYLDETCSHGERIAAMSGRSHLVAFIPQRGHDGNVSYVLVDNWDSSERQILEYWVGIPERSEIEHIADVHRAKPLPDNRPLEGQFCIHPVYGRGEVLERMGDANAPKLRIRFSGDNVRVLAEGWVRSNCVFPT
ncbi:MAG: hypothetical protein IJ865_05835 [Clostridia bacterium]|nr:hypothetical protein [Clostridia bacterium]